MKQTVAPLQAEEVNRIRREITSFDVKQHEFREEFRKTAPFNYESTHPYVRLDRVSEGQSCKSHVTLSRNHMTAISILIVILQD